MEAIETIEKGIFKAEIVQDTDPMSPWDWEENFRFISNHRHYTSLGFGKDDHRLDLSYFNGSKKEIRDYLGKGWSLFPIYAYIHSGITISMGRGGQYSDLWDSGLYGILCVNGPAIFGKRSNLTVRKCAESFVKGWDQYLMGDVYGIRIYINKGTEDDPEWEETEDSVYGFYGMDDTKKEAKRILDYKHKQEQEAQQFEKDCMAI